MSQALYRTYRPQQFADVISQDHIKLTLSNQIKSGKISHAYLFAGPRGVGKTSVARIFAKAINQTAITKYKLADTTLLDIIEIDAASHTGVDNVRENIIQNAQVAPAQLAYKVFIIDEAHMLSGSSFNALLKILEEPPAHVVFILATTEAHKIPATVVSRCQRFDFHAVKLPELVYRLQWVCQQEKVEVETVVLERIARKAQGAVRDAESMLGQLLATGDTKITNEMADVILPRVDMAVAVELFEHLVNRQAQLYTQSVATAVQSGAHMKELWQLLLELFRRGMLYSVDQSLTHLEDLDVHMSTHEHLVTLLNKLNSRDYLHLLELFMRAGELYQRSPLSQLLIEVPGLEWCTLGGTATPVAATAKPTKPAPVMSPIAPRQTAQVNTKTTLTKPLQSVNPAVAPDEKLLQQVKQNWSKIVSGTKEFNHALAMALSVGHVANAYSPNIVQLGFRYDFHKNRVCQVDNLPAIERIIGQQLGREVRVECVVGEQYDIDANMLNALPSDNIAGVNPAEMKNVWDLALEGVGEKAEKTNRQNG